MQKLFQNLIWPAVAGNVAWSFFTVAISEKWSEPSVVPRLLVLFFLAVYLCIDWVKSEKQSPQQLKQAYWIGEAFHSITTIVFSIAIYLNTSWIGLGLIIVFIVQVTGHMTGAWEPANIGPNKWQKRLALAAINASGILAFYILCFTITKGTIWHLPISMLIVLILWIRFRDKIYPV